VNDIIAKVGIRRCGVYFSWPLSLISYVRGQLGHFM